MGAYIFNFAHFFISSYISLLDPFVAMLYLSTPGFIELFLVIIFNLTILYRLKVLGFPIRDKSGVYQSLVLIIFWGFEIAIQVYLISVQSGNCDYNIYNYFPFELYGFFYYLACYHKVHQIYVGESRAISKETVVRDSTMTNTELMYNALRDEF